ncbi:MAG: DnaJ domain-containing protein [Candidatus Thorarchaeota archaeon]
MDKKESLETLRLQNGATNNEIKKKLQKLAKKSHPDLNKGNENATNDFIELKREYQTSNSDIYTPEPFVGLRRIVRERKRKKKVKDFF